MKSTGTEYFVLGRLGGFHYQTLSGLGLPFSRLCCYAVYLHLSFKGGIAHTYDSPYVDRRWICPVSQLDPHIIYPIFYILFYRRSILRDSCVPYETRGCEKETGCADFQTKSCADFQTTGFPVHLYVSPASISFYMSLLFDFPLLPEDHATKP